MKANRFEFIEYKPLFRKAKRATKHFIQRRVYGFDESDTWNLNFEMNVLLYERLKMYRKVSSNIIDLNFHKIIILDKEHTLEEWVDILLYILKRIIKDDFDFDAEEEDRYNNMAWLIWSKINDYIWW